MEIQKTKQVVLIEGLFSYAIGFVRRVYKEPLEKLGYEVISLPWTASIPKCDVVIAHSFGAGYAVKKNPMCKMLITMDARRWDFWNNSKLVKPLACDQNYNYYQSSSMRGYPINGAENIDKGATGHTRLPSAVKDEVIEIIKKERR